VTKQAVLKEVARDNNRAHTRKSDTSDWKTFIIESASINRRSEVKENLLFGTRRQMFLSKSIGWQNWSNSLCG